MMESSTLPETQSFADELRRHQEQQPENPWLGLHPASLFINLLPQTFQTLRGVWPILLVFLFADQGSGTEFFDLTLILSFFALATGRTISHFFTLRYRIQGERLELKHGLLFRQSRTLDASRIQNIEIVQNPLHKLFGLVELRIETAGDATLHGLLSALHQEEAERVRVSLKRMVKPTEERKQETEPLLKNSVLEILLYGITGRNVGTVVVVTAVGSEIFSLMNPTDAREVASLLDFQLLAGFFLLAFSGSWLWSAGRALFRHAGFRLELQADNLRTTEGLLTRRSVEIPQNKVQLIEVSEPWTRRLLGFGTIFIETAAFGIADGNLRRAEGIIPMAEQDRFSEVIQVAAPQTQVDPWTQPLLPPHPRALYRSILRKLMRSIVVSSFLVWLLLPYSWAWGALIIIPISLPLAYLDWKWQGWLITDQAIVSRRGYLLRQTWILDRNKIQSAHIYQSPFMRWHGLAQIVIRAAGSDVVLPDIGIARAKKELENFHQQWTTQRVESSAPITPDQPDTREQLPVEALGDEITEDEITEDEITEDEITEDEITEDGTIH